MSTRARKASPNREPPPKDGKPGRKTEFRPMYIDQAYELALLGLTEDEMAGVFGVVRRTITTWKDKHPKFADAVNRGKILADAKVARSLYEAACGYEAPDVAINIVGGQIVQTPLRKHYPPDFRSAQLWLHNRQSARWKKDQEGGAGGEEAFRLLSAILQRLPG